MLMLSLCNFSDAYVLVKGSITEPNTGTVTNPSNNI